MNARRQLGIIFLTLFIDLMGFSIIFPLFPHILTHYLAKEGGEGLLGWALSLIASFSSGDPFASIHTAVLFGGLLGSIYSLLQFAAAPFWGALSDRWGRKPVLLLSIAGTALSYLLWFWSESFGAFIGSRLLSGAMGGNISTASAAAADCTSRERRAAGMGIVGAAIGLGFIFGPAIGGLSERLPVTGPHPFVGAAAIAAALSLLNLGLVFFQFKETLKRGADAHKAEETVARRLVNPIAIFQRLKPGGVLVANLVYFVYFIAFSGMEFTLPFLALERFRYGPMQNALMFVFIGLLIAVVQGVLLRRLAPVHGERRLVHAGLLLIIAGFGCIGAAASDAQLYLGLGLSACGAALSTPSLSSLVSLYTTEKTQGSVIGVFRSLGALARAIGPFAACLVYWRFGAGAMYGLGALELACALALSTRLPPPKLK